MRVVIAEDNALLREGLVLLLRSAGHEVAAVAATGPEVLPLLLAHRPDAAVLDVRLPPGFRDEGLRAALAARERLRTCRCWCSRSTWSRRTPPNCSAAGRAAWATC